MTCGTGSRVRRDNRREAEARVDAESGPGPQADPAGTAKFRRRHADFFLELLPGPHDRDGLPDSIRFWKSRIEEPTRTRRSGWVSCMAPVAAASRRWSRPVCCPDWTQDVLPIYVEATAADTEVRLIKALRRQCRNLPEGRTCRR